MRGAASSFFYVTKIRFALVGLIGSFYGFRKSTGRKHEKKKFLQKPSNFDCKSSAEMSRGILNETKLIFFSWPVPCCEVVRIVLQMSALFAWRELAEFPMSWDEPLSEFWVSPIPSTFSVVSSYRPTFLCNFFVLFFPLPNLSSFFLWPKKLRTREK